MPERPGTDNRNAPTRIEHRAKTFVLGQQYSRRQIADELGGGLQEYLPHSNGHVVCACVTPSLNPGAPHVVLPGTEHIIRWGRVFAGQRHRIPVFLKRRSNAWEYAGLFRVHTM